MKPHFQNPPQLTSSLDPMFIEHLLDVQWYTASPDTPPYLVKAAASVDHGYVILITDLQRSYFCAGDKETILLEKEVSQQFLTELQKFNPTIETEGYKPFVELLHSSLSTYDPHAAYTFTQVSK